MVLMGDQREVVCSWTRWALRKYADESSFQDVVVKMLWVSLVDKFQILIVFTLTCEFNSILYARTFSFGQ
jgi:hypothetical protein